MRGKDEQQLDVFSYVSSEQRIPQDHSLRSLRAMTDEALRDLQPRFNKLYAKTGGRSVLSFPAGGCSGCGSEFPACGTWNGRVGATQRVETGAALLSSPSSVSRGAAMRNAYFDSQVLHLKLLRTPGTTV